MARFRFDREMLAESLATQIRVKNLKDVEKAYNHALPENSPFRIRGLECKYYCKDDRQGAYPETYLITAENDYDRAERFVIGMSDSQLEYPVQNKFIMFLKRLFHQ